MTTRQLADAIRNNVVDGLKGDVADFSYSFSQLVAEAFLLRSRLLDERAQKKRKVLLSFYQTLDSIPIKEIDLAVHAQVQSGICTSYIEFPKVASMFGFHALEYLGMNNKDVNARSFSIYFDDSHATHNYKSSRVKKRPYAYVDLDADENGLIKAFLYNIGPYKDKQYLTVRAIFDNPAKAIANDCCTNILDDEFPAPNEMQDIILSKLTDRYATLYRKLNIPDFPNTLTDLKG